MDARTPKPSTPGVSAAARASAMPMAVLAWDDGHLLDCNPAFLGLTGLRVDQAQDFSPARLFVTDRSGNALPLLRSLHQSTETYAYGPWRGEASLRRGDDRLLDVSYTAARFEDSGTTLISLTVNDVTSEKCLSCKIHISREKYRRVVDDQPDLLCRFMADSTVMFANEAFAAAHGLLPYEVVGRKLTDLLPAERADALRAWLATLTPRDHLTDSADPLELPMAVPPRQPGAELWWRRRAIFGPSGHLAAVQSIGRSNFIVRPSGVGEPDAAIYEALDRLRDSEEHRRRVFNALDEGVAVFDSTGRALRVNPAAERLLGLPSGSAAGQGANDLNVGFVDSHGQRIATRQLPLAVALREGRRVEGSAVGLRLEDGGMRWLRVNAQPILLPGWSAAGALVSFADVSEITRATHELSEAKLYAETANATKTQFLANMSHELRTPLNAVLGYSEAILSEMFGPLENMQHRDYLGIIHTSGEHLLRLIDDILEVSCIEMGEVRLLKEDVDIAALAQEVTDLLSVRADAAGVGIKVAAASDVGIWRGDRHRLLQILLNLGSNATKFSGKDADVFVDLYRTNDAPDAPCCLAIRVRDTGIGIAADQLEAIWEPFRQVEQAMTRTRGGVGLGLPIVRRLVEAHNGTITMQSTVGRGTTVTVKLPYGDC